MAFNKKSIFAFCGCYLPGSAGGGPIKSVSNIVSTLGDEFQFHVITSDRDLNARKPYAEIVPNEWNSVGKAKVNYVQKNIFAPWRIFRLLRCEQYDLIYLNSFFDPIFSIFPMIINRYLLKNPAPVLLAPRGEFSEGAIEIKKFKKAVFISFVKLLGLYKNIYWHASTSYEKNDIIRVFDEYGKNIEISKLISAADISKTEKVLEHLDSESNKSSLKICFLSRVSRKKNLDYALSILKQSNLQITFSVYGPIEDPDYWEECQSIIRTMPPNITVKNLGPVEPDLVVKELSSHDIFFLPTHGENFGHVIVEAWAAGLPVLLSDQTPWRNLQEKNIGWDLNLACPQDFANALLEAVHWSADKWSQVRNSCLAEAEAIINDDKVVDDNRNMFYKAMN